jgi:hypothetical protein
MTSTVIDTWQKFADIHILDKEIDPLYEFLRSVNPDHGPFWVDRFILHLLMFYDVGGAVKCASSSDHLNFWTYVKEGYDGFPRGTNRRHSRGDLGRAYMDNLSTRGDPTEILEGMYAPTYTGLVNQVDRYFKGCGFGPYFIWKVMDFQDRCLRRPVDITLAEAVKYLPDEPRKGAMLVFPGLSLGEALSRISEHISQYDAPGIPSRKCGLPEAESLLCALRGYVKGTYHHGKDLEERHRQLAGFPYLLKYLPPIPRREYVRSALVTS